MESTPRERAEFFLAEVWPRVSALGDPYRGLKTLALSMAHDILELTEDDGS